MVLHLSGAPIQAAQLRPLADIGEFWPRLAWTDAASATIRARSSEGQLRSLESDSVA